MALGSAAVSAWPTTAPRAMPSPDGSSRARSKSRRTNIIMVLADDIGYGEIGCYGQKKIKTPNIDRLAREGLRFTDGYASASVCAPARASLLTGLHTGHCSVRRNPGPQGELPLDPSEATIAEVLKAEGYRTALFGKWGFGQDRGDQPGHPVSRGFTDFFGYLTHHSAKSYYPRRLWDGRTPITYPGNTGDVGLSYGPDLITERALAFLRQHRDDPFLMMLTLPLPHAPSVAPNEGRYRDRKNWKPADRIHAAQISKLDDYVGLVVREVRDLGLDDNTIIIFTSDNGAHQEGGVHPSFFDASGPYRGIKRNLYEGGIRVPFIAWSPKIMSRTAGKRTAHQTVHYDLMATVTDFAGVATPTTDGLSLRKVFTGAAGPPKHKYLYWTRLHAGSTPLHLKEDHGRGRNAAAAVRFGGHWKLVGFAPGPEYSAPGKRWRIELYDLRNDPGERHDLAGDRPKLVREGLRYLRESWRHPKAP
ncbi:MAG: arylsulfatase [Streptosporangiaceae bacterium]